MAEDRGMPGSHIPTCPAALSLVYYRKNYRHEILLAFDVLGNRVVNLDTGRQWSGWHGQWDPWNLGGLMIWMSYTGVEDRARPHFFERVMPRVYELNQSRLIRVFASMVTRLDLLPQLDMVPAPEDGGMAEAPMWPNVHVL